MIKIGLTGNIASGKSTVEKILKNKGLKVVDLDNVSHSLLETTCKNDVYREFGTTDRNEIASIVFQNKEKLKKLEDIIYPKLKDFILSFFKKNENEKISIVSGALIFEAGFDKLFDKTIFVDAPKDIRLQRLIKRNNYTPEEANRRINAQTGIAKKLANYVIDNSKDENALNREVERILLDICG